MNSDLKNIIDYCDEYLPGFSVILDEIRRTKIDLKTFLLSLKNNIPPVTPANQMLTIELTNICNSNCIFCAYQYQNKYRTRKGFMSDEIFEKSVREYKNLGGSHLGLTPFAGEPLLDKKILDRIRKIKSEGLWTGFFTNGILLNDINIEELLLTNIDTISISTAPLDKNMYEMIYRNNHYFDMLNGVKKLLECRNKHRKEMIISLTIRSHIRRKLFLALPDFREIIMPLLSKDDWKYIIVNTRGLDTWGGLIKKNDMVGMMRLALIPRLKYLPCAWLYNLYLTWDGHVRACPCRYSMSDNADGKDELYLGNIRESTLAELYNGTKIKQLFIRFKENKLPLLCRSCTMYKPVASTKP